MTSCPRPRHPRLRSLALAAIVGVLALPATVRAQEMAVLPQGFHDQFIADGLDRPVGMAFLPDGRLIVIENDAGRVRLLVDGKFGAVDPIGTIDSLSWIGSEEGLMGVAADPQWPARPYLYFHYAGTDSSLHVTRYTVLGDLEDPTSGFLMMDPGSKYRVLQNIPNVNPLHDGGTLRFGPDGMLYASFGDDGMACTATDSTALHGVILRLDVSGLPDGPGGPPDRTLLVAAGNPYQTHPDVNVRLVWALGMRNPFRFHIDPATGALFAADVGQSDYEEVDWFPGPGAHGGWPFFEGTGVYVTTECGLPAPAPLTPPIAQYNHVTLSAGAASVISGDIYRPSGCAPCSFPDEYDGDYFYSDFYEGFLRRLTFDGANWVPADPAPGQPNATDWATGFRFVSDFLVGPDGALWYCRWATNYTVPFSGEIRRVYYLPVPADVGDAPLSSVRFESPFPTPARGATSFSYWLPEEMAVRLELFDMAGRRVRTLASARQAPGRHVVTWDGDTDAGGGAAPGVYVARLTVDGETLARRVPLIR